MVHPNTYYSNIKPLNFINTNKTPRRKKQDKHGIKKQFYK